MLIFNTVLRDAPSSDEENLMIKNLIDLWYNFATKNQPVFNDFVIEKSSNDGRVKCLEIFSPSNYKMTSLNENFGETEFWRNIENSLKSNTLRVDDEL